MKIIDTLKTASDADKVNYSIGIKEQKIRGTELNEYLNRMLEGDFGKVTGTLANDFKRRIETGDKDVYGIYGNDIVVYYDAETDEITFVTGEEFRNYYQKDWLNEDRIGFNVRYGGARQNIKEGRFVKEGQTREILGKLEETMGENAPGLVTTARLDYKIYPHTDYQGMIKELGPERMEKIKALAKAKGIYPKRLLQLIAYQHYVQHKTTEDSYQYALRSLEKDVAMLKAKDSDDFTKKTAQGYEIVEAWETDTGRKFVIIKRKTDYAIGAGYDTTDGTWGAGYYDYDSAIDARQAMYHNYPYNEFKRITL